MTFCWFRYRKLSTLVHPDKRLDMPQARDAFEEVKKAYQVRLFEKSLFAVCFSPDLSFKVCICCA